LILGRKPSKRLEPKTWKRAILKVPLGGDRSPAERGILLNKETKKKIDRSSSGEEGIPLHEPLYPEEEETKDDLESRRGGRGRRFRGGTGIG